MYDESCTAVPRDEDHFWTMVEDNYQHARYVLTGLHVESIEDALARDGPNLPMTVIPFRDVSPDYDQRDYCIEMGRSLLDPVRAMIKARQLTIEFAQEWGKLQFCHGYIAAHLFDDKDTMAHKRGARQRADEISVDDRRAWVARILTAKVEQGLPRKAAEREVVRVAEAFHAAGGFGESYPAEWFASILQGGQLKTTYGKGQMPNKRLSNWSEWSERELPPLEYGEVNSGPR